MAAVPCRGPGCTAQNENQVRRLPSGKTFGRRCSAADSLPAGNRRAGGGSTRQGPAERPAVQPPENLADLFHGGNTTPSYFNDLSIVWRSCIVKQRHPGSGRRICQEQTLPKRNRAVWIKCTKNPGGTSWQNLSSQSSGGKTVKMPKNCYTDPGVRFLQKKHAQKTKKCLTIRLAACILVQYHKME